MRVILIRHAEARREANPTSGPALDLGLTAAGRGQAKALAEFLRANETATHCDKHLVSPLRRAVETAQIVSASLGIAHFDKRASFSEVCELHDRAESVQEGFLRVRDAMSSLAAEAHGTALVITHAGFIVASMRELLAIPMNEHGGRLEPDYAGLTSWRFERGVWYLESYNVVPGAA